MSKTSRQDALRTGSGWRIAKPFPCQVFASAIVVANSGDDHNHGVREEPLLRLVAAPDGQHRHVVETLAAIDKRSQSSTQAAISSAGCRAACWCTKAMTRSTPYSSLSLRASERPSV